VTAILEIVSRIRTGELSKPTAEKIIATSFPVSNEEAKALISEVEEGEVKEEGEEETGKQLQPNRPGPNPIKGEE